MTEYELSDLIATSISNASEALAVLIGTVSAYLTVAWIVGAKLTRAQVTLVNLIYLVFCFFTVFGWWARMNVALYYKEQILLLNPNRDVPLSFEVIVLATIIFSLIILFSIKFMWDIRHVKISH